MDVAIVRAFIDVLAGTGKALVITSEARIPSSNTESTQMSCRIQSTAVHTKSDPLRVWLRHLLMQTGVLGFTSSLLADEEFPLDIHHPIALRGRSERVPPSTCLS